VGGSSLRWYRRSVPGWDVPGRPDVASEVNGGTNGPAGLPSAILEQVIEDVKVGDVSLHMACETVPCLVRNLSSGRVSRKAAKKVFNVLQNDLGLLAMRGVAAVWQADQMHLRSEAAQGICLQIGGVFVVRTLQHQ
jgi:hypothetical protein